MLLTTNLIGREIAAAALDHHKKLAQDVAALNRRLGYSEKEANEGLSTNKYLRSAFEKVSTDEQGAVGIEMGSRNSAATFRIALIEWASLATKRDQSVHQLTLSTDIDERKLAAQEMVNALSDQLSLPIEDISVLADKHGKAEKPEKGPKDPAVK